MYTTQPPSLDSDVVLEMHLPSTNCANEVKTLERTLSDSDSSTSTLGESSSIFSDSLGTASKRGACCNYINLTVGGGVVAIPKAGKYVSIVCDFVSFI